MGDARDVAVGSRHAICRAPRFAVVTWTIALRAQTFACRTQCIGLAARSARFQEWKIGRRAREIAFGARSMESGAWNVGCEGWVLECEVRTARSEVRRSSVDRQKVQIIPATARIASSRFAMKQGLPVCPRRAVVKKDSTGNKKAALPRLRRSCSRGQSGTHIGSGVISIDRQMPSMRAIGNTWPRFRKHRTAFHCLDAVGADRRPGDWLIPCQSALQ